MNCEIFAINEGAKRYFHKKVKKLLIDLAVVLLFAWIMWKIHSILKLKKVVIVRP